MSKTILKWAFSILFSKIVELSSDKWSRLVALVASFETSNLSHEERYNRTIDFLKSEFKISSKSTLNFAVELSLKFVKTFIVKE